MGLLHTDSLLATVDAAHDALFFNHTRCKAARLQAARFIASRVGRPGGYAGMPAMTERDWAGDFHLFTGERITTGAARGHIIGEEACRVMRQFVVNDDRVQNPKVEAALHRAESVMVEDRLKANTDGPGFFCCGKCSVAMWRNVMAGAFGRQRQRLAGGVEALRSLRDGKGRWKRFPYWFTLLALVEMPGKPALDELRYAAKGCERLLKGKSKEDLYDTRQRAVAERALERIG